MATDTFLYFEQPGPGAPPIEGETTDQEFKAKKAIEIESYTYGYDNPVDVGSASGGSGAGRVNFAPLSVSIKLDTTFTQILQACCSGGHYGQATLVRRRAGADKTKVGTEFFKLEMKEAMISGVNVGAGAGGGPQVSLQISYAAVRSSYTPQKPDGSAGPKTEKTWSRTKNTDQFAV